MATLALSLGGQFVGGLFGGPIGATVGRALGALAGAQIDNVLFGERPQPAPHADVRLQGSVEGGPIPRLYGWSRISGNIVWATELEELAEESAGAKGSGDDPETTIAASFAVALCEGEVARLGRIWADGQPLDTSGITIRFYRGSEDQGVDSLIEAKQGTGNAPAYRGLCYLVFERLPLEPFGNRIPQIAVELCRVVGELEPAIRAVTVIPGATEFGYDPVARVRVVSPGVTANENTHLAPGVSDWTLSIDELVALCPNLSHVALVVAWFGDDLRCGECLIKPRVEANARTILDVEWGVAGLTRGTAPVVTEHDGGPAYGGTPSDASVLAAIADLKSRGIGVTLYPIVLMDIPHGNAMGQPAYPWRGRITGTGDGTGAVTAQVAAFAGTGSDWRFRRMVRHYAQLAVSAGGVDAMVIGSEMRAMSFLRDGAGGFPFVSALVALAAEVRAIVGPSTKLTYAADWSEFSGRQVGGDKWFHLDPLWASANIDAVGIDNYMPVADWRDGTDHADWAVADGPYDPAYLEGGVAGGEGFDWYYASDADRVAGTRSAITDGAHGEPWVWRFKDIRSWWENAHHNRVGGVRSVTATAWVPESKPVWFTELGCGAVDKGANQPNVFGDAKSSEDARPYFSSGAPDPLMQRQVLRAHLAHWGDADNNPAGMVDPERIYLWTWDARPYPAFPAETSTWRDGENHATGHWLSGRLGAMTSDELIAAMAADFGVDVASVDAVPPLMQGLVVEGVVAARDAIAAVVDATGLAVSDRPEGLAFAVPKARLAVDVPEAVATDGPLVSRRRSDPSAALGSVSLTYPDRERGYLTGTMTAIGVGGGVAAARATGLVLDASGARAVAERALAVADGETLELTVPPLALALEAGDAIEAGDGTRFQIAELRDGLARKLSAREIVETPSVGVLSDRGAAASSVPPAVSVPLVEIVHLPAEPGDPLTSRLMVAAWASPWPGRVSLVDETTGVEVTAATRAAWIGELVDPLMAGHNRYWDRRSVVRVKLYAGHLASLTPEAVLAGGNRIAVETDAGAWEVVGFAGAELVAPRVYELSVLLRGQQGTDHAVGAAAAGNRVVVLNDRVVPVGVPAGWLGETLALRAYAGAADADGVAVPLTIGLPPALPLSPVHLGAVRGVGASDVALSWVRRSRADANGWGVADAALDHAPEAYRVVVYDGVTVKRTVDVDTTEVVYTAAQQVADFGVAPAGFVFTVQQRSAVVGLGHAAMGTFAG